MEIHFAPIQGNTDAAYRNTHAELFKPADFYYTPFIRWEHDGIRPRDIKDISTESNPVVKPIPQIIFRDDKELQSLVSALYEMGERRIDLNMGCPFPLQTARGRGAALAGNADMAREVVRITQDYPDVEFSVKMRLGFKDPDEWRNTLPVLNEAKLRHITLHPRFAAQQYGGEPDLDRFAEFLSLSEIPVIYNGDITDLGKYEEIVKRFPGIKGVMIGRGLIARPTLTEEIAESKEMPREERLQKLLRFHRSLLNHYREILCGDAQILGKIKPFWEYSEQEIGRKPWKAIRKAVNMAKYQTAVAMISDDL